MATATATVAADAEWMPRPGREIAAGCVWLPRFMDKGRRLLQGGAAGRDLLWPYMYGDHDYMDVQLLRFLRTRAEPVLDLLRAEPSDAAAAAELVRRSGRTPRECASWSRWLLVREAWLLVMLDADEGRLAPGRASSLLRWLLNALVVPPAHWWYRRQEGLGRPGGPAPA